MSQHKNQVFGTACCDCTVACKYRIVEDLCEQEEELFAHFLTVNKAQDLLNFLFIESILRANERYILHKADKFFMKYIENIRTQYFGDKRLKCRENVLLSTEKGTIITILG
jgi:hypothetical protein